jgi:hypothetical protein
MFSKTKLALVGALVLGLGTVAQAGSKDDADHAGGYRVGPLSQRFAGANPVQHPSMRGRIYTRRTSGSEAYAYVPRSTSRTLPRGEETYIGVQDRMYRRSNGG